MDHDHLGSNAQPLRAFKLERYFAAHEFVAPRLLCCSDCEPLTLRGLLAQASPPLRRLYDDLGLGYTESRGHPLLLQAIAALHPAVPALAVPGGPLAPIVIAPQEGVYLAMRALLARGDRVVCTMPGYQSLSEVAIAIGCTVVPWWAEGVAEQRTEETPSPPFGFDLDALAALLGPRGTTKLLVVNFPHNPTGSHPSHEEWAALLACCRAADCYLFSDEMYRGLELNGVAPLASAVELYDKAVVLCGVSKALSLPGLRIGWLLSQSKSFLDRVSELKDFTTICSSAPSEILALIALENRDAIIAANVALVLTNVNVHLRPFFTKHEAWVVWREPEAGTVAFPRLTPRALAERWASVEVFCAELRVVSGVLLLPAAVYADDALAQTLPPCFRLGFGRADLPASLALLDAFLDAPALPRLNFNVALVPAVQCGTKRATTRLVGEEDPASDTTKLLASWETMPLCVATSSADGCAFALLRIVAVHRVAFSDIDDELARVEDCSDAAELKALLRSFYPFIGTTAEEEASTFLDVFHYELGSR